MAGLGRVGTRVTIGVVTVLSVAAVSWLVSPAFAQGRSTSMSLKTASAGVSTGVAGGVAPGRLSLDKNPSASAQSSLGSLAIGAPLSTSAALTPNTMTPFEMSYGKHRRQNYLAYLPAERTSPIAVVVIHGGGWVAGAAEDTEEYNARLYTEGVASFSLDYRYATDAPWPAQRSDLAAALKDIRKHAVTWKIDPAGIGVIGISAGGHLALDLASGAGARATCAVVSYSGPTSMKLVIKDAVTGVKQAGLAKAAKQLTPSKKTKADATVPHSPSAKDAPALLFASEYDWVDNVNTSRYADAYAGVDLDVQGVILSGEHRHASGYALNDPEVWSKTLDFLGAHCN